MESLRTVMSWIFSLTGRWNSLFIGSNKFANVFCGGLDVSFWFFFFFLCYSPLATVLGAAVLLNKEAVKNLQIQSRRIQGGNSRDPKYILERAHTSRLLRLLESCGGQHTRGSPWLFSPAGIILASILK